MNRKGILLVGLVLFVFLAGCMDAGEDEPRYREDTATVTVPADGSIEYKLFVAEGDAFDYEWSAGSILFFDFHGEHEGDTSGDFTSHKAGTSGRDEGSLTAPFTGTHGWYWENQGDEDVTVELSTQGVYRVEGTVE